MSWQKWVLIAYELFSLIVVVSFVGKDRPKLTSLGAAIGVVQTAAAIALVVSA